jgi:poly-gamma-glutamate capsule biosynthesis protein CapA/YwtB (metallophosphatase superfamily)
VSSGRHRAKARVPFAALLAILVLAAGAAFVFGREGAPIPSATATRTASGAATITPTGAGTTPSASPSVARGTLVIHAAGDVSLDPSYISTYAANGYGYAWSGLNGLFRHDDLSIVNVECPVSDEGTQIAKEFSFHGTPAALPAMHDAGVDVGSLANNHAYDRGPDALVDSIRNLGRAGIAPVGAGKDQDDALKPALFDLRGWKVAVLGFDEVLDPLDEVAGPDKPGTAAGHDFSLMVHAVERARSDADLVVVMIHWGVELDTQPRGYQVSEGHRLIDAGADMIFGAHSHRLQPFDVYEGKPIFWSLGNFVWPNFSAEGSTTAVAEVIVRPDGTIRARALPAFIEASGHPVLR